MLRFLTAGESHGPTQTAILEGIPAGLSIGLNDIQSDLDKRKGNVGRGGRGRIEKDIVKILSGVRFGKTIGSPISLLVENKDFYNWKERMKIENTKNNKKDISKITNPRPGHADLAGVQKYGFDDIRNVIERASARETVIRTAIGAVCKKFLSEFNIVVISKPIQIGKSIIRTKPGKEYTILLENLIREAITAKDTLGGVIEITAMGIPPGLGSYIQWDKRLDGLLAQALMSIPSVKAVEIGEGIKSARKTGSEVHDQICWLNGNFKRLTNRAGGIEGGISNGENIVSRVFLKPLPTLSNPLNTVDIKSKNTLKAHIERSDVCVIPRAGVICEAMTAITLTQVFLEKFGQDSMRETKRNFRGYIKNLL